MYPNKPILSRLTQKECNRQSIALFLIKPHSAQSITNGESILVIPRL